MKKSFALFISSILLMSCANQKNYWEDHVTSFGSSRGPQSVYEFIDYIPKIEQQVKNRDIFSMSSCSQFIDKYANYVYTKSSEFYFPKSAEEKDYFYKKGSDSLQGLFNIRIALKDFIGENTNVMTDECLTSIKKAMRFSRFAEDNLAEWMYNNSPTPSSIPKILLTGGKPHVIQNAAFDKIEFRPGDLILMRGQSFVSAMIARIGNADAQFSHLGIVGQDKTGKLYLVEALIETGAIYTPLEDFLKKEEARLVLMRQDDEALAKKAARKIFDFVYEKKSKKEVVPYDFGMIDTDHAEMFCSEIIRYAYELASDNSYEVPMFRTSFTKLINSDFMTDMGIKAKEAFAPADVEVDPRFKVVAEFRTIPRLRKIRMQDSILTSIFSWIEEKNYDVRFNLELSAKSKLAKTLRLLGLLEEKMQKHMPAKTVETTLKFQNITLPLEKNIMKLESEYFEKNGHSMTFKNFLAINEEMRKRDCEAFKRNEVNANFDEGYKPEKVEFHELLRPKYFSSCE